MGCGIWPVAAGNAPPPPELIKTRSPGSTQQGPGDHLEQRYENATPKAQAARTRYSRAMGLDMTDSEVNTVLILLAVFLAVGWALVEIVMWRMRK